MTYTAPPDYDWDLLKISVDPTQLEFSSGQIKGLIHMISGCVEKIANTCSSLTMDWAGESADDSKHFFDYWKEVMLEVFGWGFEPSDNPFIQDLLTELAWSINRQPGIGAFVKLQVGVQWGAGNYKLAESEIVKAFRSFADAISAPGNSVGDGSRDINSGPVLEHNNKK